MKNQRLNLRITPEDLAVVKAKATKANMTLTDYVTKVALGKQIIVIPDLAEVLKQQKAIGRNLNQLTILANMGRVQIVYLLETLTQMGEISCSLQQILERKRWSDGNS